MQTDLASVFAEVDDVPLVLHRCEKIVEQLLKARDSTADVVLVLVLGICSADCSPKSEYEGAKANA